MKFTLIENGIRSSLVIFYPKLNDLITYNESHPRWSDLLEIAKSGELDNMDEDSTLKFINSDSPNEALDLLAQVGSRIEITTRGATLDGETIDPSLAQGIKAVLGTQEISDDHMNAIKRFLEKADSNPSMENSTRLYKWIASERLTLASDGDFIGYKKVTTTPTGRLDFFFDEDTALPNGDEPVKCADVLRNKDTTIYRASYAGGGIVDGVEFPGNVPNYVGAVVEMPRDKVDADGRVECSVGLHVGTFGYASRYQGDTMLLVKVNPRDVVSVPEYDFTKLRTCRYTVIAAEANELDSSVYIDEQYAPIFEEPVGEGQPSVLTVEEKSGIVSRIINRIKASRAS